MSMLRPLDDEVLSQLSAIIRPSGPITYPVSPVLGVLIMADELSLLLPDSDRPLPSASLRFFLHKRNMAPSTAKRPMTALMAIPAMAPVLSPELPAPPWLLEPEATDVTVVTVPPTVTV
jgi:hypothetical protein